MVFVGLCVGQAVCIELDRVAKGKKILEFDTMLLNGKGYLVLMKI